MSDDQKKPKPKPELPLPRIGRLKESFLDAIQKPASSRAEVEERNRTACDIAEDMIATANALSASGADYWDRRAASVLLRECFDGMSGKDKAQKQISDAPQIPGLKSAADALVKRGPGLF